MDRHAATYDRYHNEDAPEPDDEPDTIEAVRLSVVDLRCNVGRLTDTQIDRALERIDDRLAALALAHEECEQRRLETIARLAAGGCI